MIELLAVIIILGVLMLVAIPSVTEYINTSKKNTFLNTASNLVDNAKKYVISNSIIEGQEFDITDGTFDIEGFDVKGKLPESGVISVNEEMQTAIAVTNGSWCAKKGYADQEITVTKDNGDCSIDSVNYTNQLCFAFNSTTGMITDYYDYQDNNSSNPACPIVVIIPRTFGGNEVTSIGPGAFIMIEKDGQYCRLKTDIYDYDTVALDYIHTEDDLYYSCNFDYNWHSVGWLESVIIPNTVTEIYYAAFEEAGLANITIPNGVTKIGDFAFAMNDLSSVTIPENVTKIGIDSFSSNLLESVIIPSNVTSIGEGSFLNNMLTSINIQPNITTIADYAFAGNQLENITIPNGITNIGVSAFNGNLLTSVTIPSSVATIGDEAFEQNSFGTVTIRYNGTNIQTRFDARKNIIGWTSATMNYVSD